jgi:two-component system phosphate regulon sensor histidine kinase PhoR
VKVTHKLPILQTGMKVNRTHVFIAISSCALVLLLIFQINWVRRTAAMKEQLFNEKANMVLSRTTEAIEADQQLKVSIDQIMKESRQDESLLRLDEESRSRIEDLLNNFMSYYNFHPDFSFELAKILPPSSAPTPYQLGYQTTTPLDQQACYDNYLIQMANKNGWELKLAFPNKEAFLSSEMTMPFITSILLIIIVLFLFLKTTLSLLKEKRISEHTTDFLNNMTHEFKTPLTNIGLAGKMITKSPSFPNEEKVKHYSEIILEENEKLKLQVEHVLSMTALERGEIPVVMANVDLHQLIRDCAKNMSLQISNKEGYLELKLTAEKSMINGDQSHLINTICNLIDNAIKYSGDNLRIEIESFNNDNNLIIQISDNGIGIDKLHLKNIFTKFFRVPTGNVHDVKGFGLGLAYVKKIINLHHGSIEVQSQKGKGTIFKIILPNVEG